MTATLLQGGAPVTSAGFEYAPAVIAPAPAHSLAALPTLPFAAQLGLIERELDNGSAPDALLRALAGLRDHEPLAHAVVRAARAGLLTSVADAVAAVFATLPDTGVQRVLRATIAAEQRESMPAEQRAVIVAAVRTAMETLPLARCAALCLMDRWLKNASPETRAAVVARAVDALEAALAPGGTDGQDALAALPDEVLMRVPGQELARLAGAQPAAIRARLEARLSAFADRVLDVLGAAPKSLSQANAEELLSRRVYTDPGHFLVELLQNAEDAGARAWRVDIGDHDVAVWHDGTPFDAKDVVGVLSIGQTTKHKEQIGFFGVGFKSVYEICERPQVYSGPFCFEIADVSIPRRLASRPAGWPGDGTLLVLELRDLADPERNPDRLYERALDVPPETLLTLRNIRALAASRGARTRTVRAEDSGPGTGSKTGSDTGSPRSQRVDLVHVESDTRTGYVTVRDRFAYDGGGREGSRASATDVLVALRLDECGLRAPLPAGAATVYSFLPTRERSGLRFLVHAHFDLPVDRERLDLDSRYNRWVLAQAGSLLARAAHEVVAGDAPGRPARLDRVDRARALLDVLPRPDELSHPAYVALAEQARNALATVPCLPGADGALVAPRQAALAEDAALAPLLAEVLAGVDLDGQGQRLLGALSPSAARTAAYLGARRFDTAALVALVARTPEVLDRGEAVLLDVLGRATEEAEIGRLSDVAFARDHQGRRARPGALARADEALRAIYERVRPLLAADLDLAASPEKERLWRRLDVPVLDARTLIADLGDEATAGALLHGQGARAVVAYLVARPAHFAAFVEALASGAIAMDAQRARALHAALDAVADDLSPRLGARLGRAALFPDRHGALRPLAGPSAALVPADDEIVGLAPDAPWLDAEIAAMPYIARLLGHLDVQPTGAAAVTGALLLEDDRLLDATDDATARRAYAYLIAHADEVPASLRRRLAAAPAWFSAEGVRLPLAALRRSPRDATLAALYQAWRAVSLIDERGPASALALATALGLDAQVAATDHDALVEDLHRGATAGLDIAPVRGLVCAALRDAARVLPRGRLVRAARAPLFRVEGAGRTSDELWPLAGWSEQLEAGCGRALGALRVALAHGSRPLLAATDEDEWAVFLAAIAGDPAAAPATVIDLVSALERDPAMQAPAARDAGRRSLAALRKDVAAHLGTDVGRARLRALPIWPIVSTGPVVTSGPALAPGPTRHGDHRPAHAVVRGRDLVALLALDAGERDAVARVGMTDRSSAIARGRSREASGEGALKDLGEASGGDAGEHAIEGAMENLGDVWRRAFASGEHGLLDEAAAGAEADALADLCSFADPRRALRAAIAAVARPGEPVAAQHPLLATPARVAHLARAVARDAGAEVVRGLPLSVDAAGRLVTGVRHHAGERERAITAGLPVHDQLGDPVWAALVGDELAPRLSLRQILSAVADDARSDVAVAAHPRLADTARRAAVYQWLLERGQDILADEQARGLLGRATVIATTGGFLRPVRALLLDRALPDLGIDWNAADEVPAELVAWLRRHFAPDEHQLVRLVGHLLDACDAAAAAGDGGRSAELLGHLARSLRVGEVEPREVEAAVQRFKLRKRLRVETDGGDFARPRTLLAPPPGDWPLITAFAAEPPARVSARYYTDEAVRTLIAAAGAAERLGEDTLRALVAGTGRSSGAVAGIALARYLARWASREPALRDSLHLRSAAWVPDGTGALRTARALYWPDSDAPLVVGEDPRRYPHPELAHTAPAELAAWLPFCRLDEAALEDLVAHIDALLAHGREPGVEVLAWLERGLERGRLRSGEVRTALATRRFLRDDDGVLRTADEVVREGAHELFGGRRGTWSAGDGYTRLAGALKIARRPGKREVLGYLEALAEIVDARGLAAAPADAGIGPDGRDEAAAAVLAEEPGLLATLPRCLAVLAEAGGALPARLPLACENTAGTAVLCIAPDPRLALPRPPAAVEAAMAAAAPYLFPLLPEGDGEAVLALLAGFGIPDLAGDSGRATEESDADAREARAPARRPERPAGQSRRQPRPTDDRAARHHEDPDERASEDGHASGEEERDRDVTATEAFPEQSPTSRGWLGRLRGWLSPRGQDEPPEGKEDRDAEREVERKEHRKPRSDDRREDAREAGAERPRPGSTGKPGRSATRPPRSGATGGTANDSDASSEDSPPAAPDQRAWFRPRQRIGAQMHDHSAWIADRTRAAAYGLAFEPRALPAPYLYGPQTIAGRFQAAGQRWLEIPLDPSWRQAGSSGADAQAGAAGAHTMTLRGRVPVGEVVLPVPLFGHVTSVRATPAARLLETRGGAPLLVATEDTEVEYTVTLPPAPRYEDATLPRSAPDALLAPTADDRELPDEALRLADELASSALPPLPRALAVRDFVRTRYFYDPAYLESPEVARWLDRLGRGRSNAHLAALHAGRDDRHLGRGVCYELNAMVCELLRRAGMPAAVATGWTFDRGYVDEPDHMWAMTLLDTADGLRWLPIDASTTREGRPLHVGRRPPGPWRAPADRGRAAPPPPAWDRERDVRRYEPESVPLGDLMRVVRYLEQVTGQQLGDASQVRELCRQILQDAGAGRGLLDLVRALAEREPD